MKLATVQKITNIYPIDGADKIELATVLGWQVVVKKGEYKIGDLCVYIPIDTIVPEKPEFEFLRPRKFRVTTIKLRGAISQGLIVPLLSEKNYEGQDLTELLGIKKYEKDNANFEQPYNKKKDSYLVYKLKQWFPFFFKKEEPSPFPRHLVPITDEERIQNIPNVLQRLKGQIMYASYKLDGSSITIIHEKRFGKSNFRICSRRLELHDESSAWIKAFHSTGMKKHVLDLVDYFGTNNIIVQGELIGQKFNGNHHGLMSDEIRIFNIFVDGKKLTPPAFFDVQKKLDLPVCPLYSVFILNHTLPQILEMSNIKDPINEDVPAEGLVWRSEDGRYSFKAVNNEYLLLKKE